MEFEKNFGKVSFGGGSVRTAGKGNAEGVKSGKTSVLKLLGTAMVLAIKIKKIKSKKTLDKH